jgi:mono/diheme cytochrome c family protein
MKRRSFRVGAYPLLIAGVAFVAFNCTSAIPHLSSDELAHAKREQHLDLEYGRSTYISNCAGCHQLHRPSEYTASEWGNVFPEMATKARLSSLDSASVISYLKASAKSLAKH